MKTSHPPTFPGFSAAGIGFLRELAQNNNRPWFEAHRARYERDVRAPARALVAALGERLASAFPPTAYSTAGNGGSLMRINRDVRFSSDKSPYKAQIAMMFVPEGRAKMGTPGFGLQITTKQVELVAGQFAFDPGQLAAFRRAVLDDSAGSALSAAAAHLAPAGGLAADSASTAPYPLGGRRLKRVPRGYDADHPRAEWLTYKGLHVFSPPISLAVAATPELVNVAMTHFHQMAPIWAWLMRYVENVRDAGAAT